jgi:hypothetical protein
MLSAPTYAEISVAEDLELVCQHMPTRRPQFLASLARKAQGWPRRRFGEGVAVISIGPHSLVGWKDREVAIQGSGGVTPGLRGRFDSAGLDGVRPLTCEFRYRAASCRVGGKTPHRVDSELEPAASEMSSTVY